MTAPCTGNGREKRCHHKFSHTHRAPLFSSLSRPSQRERRTCHACRDRSFLTGRRAHLTPPHHDHAPAHRARRAQRGVHARLGHARRRQAGAAAVAGDAGQHGEREGEWRGERGGGRFCSMRAPRAFAAGCALPPRHRPLHRRTRCTRMRWCWLDKTRAETHACTPLSHQLPTTTTHPQTSSLPPNDDAREKEAARRRRSATGDGRALEADLGKGAQAQQQAAPAPPRAPALDAAAVAALYQNCLKLASENKITAKNTWALPLIDHMADLVASDAAARGGATDFARASLTLAAGVSIYAHRVDAVHGDVFRILGGLGRATGDDDGEEEEAADGDGGKRRRRRHRAACTPPPPPRRRRPRLHPGTRHRHQRQKVRPRVRGRPPVPAHCCPVRRRRGRRPAPQLPAPAGGALPRL